ncbi:MAG: (2Fe-2S)-binding protein [Planctomycetota bacterium]
MADLTIRIDGRAITVRTGTTLAAAMLREGIPARRSVGGEPRAPLCGMGICFECRVNVDGARLQRACLLECRDGMEVRTDDR